MKTPLEQFDLVVIGAGPAGYTGAIRASQLGFKVACIEKKQTLGGACLNEGCIPSKALLNYSEKYEESLHHFEDIGIEVAPKLNLSKMLAKKNKVVSDLCKGIDALFTKNKISRIQGEAKITGPDEVTILSEGATVRVIKTKNILIATGSEILDIPGVQIDGKDIISSKEALGIESVPSSMVVIGGGYIGLELGSVWRRLGAKVTVVEFYSRIVPAMDTEVANTLHKILVKQGMEFIFDTKVLSCSKSGAQLKLSLEKAGEKSEILTDKVLVSVGRKPYTQNLGLENVGIKVNERGRIPVNAHFQTLITNIYAVGDVIDGPMLAHKAEEEAIAAVEIMAGQAGHVNYKVIPSVVYTNPEVASVGMTEDQLKTQGREYKVGKFPFLANSRARAMGETEGFVKILADKNTDEILGAHIIGVDAGTLIAEIALGMEFKAAAEDIARTCHAHPTLNEAVKEAALAIEKRAINF
ncbi:MAG: dihydrolipoyl dehydrogenase [Alphaproteobacteria bacterium]|nr:dihydrolipoyl dehydrogenase [Alphaproteobacteria bacterium]